MIRVLFVLLLIGLTNVSCSRSLRESIDQAKKQITEVDAPISV